MTNALNRMLSLRSVFFKMDRSTQKLTTGRSATEAHDRPFDTKAHDKQDTFLRHLTFAFAWSL